MTCERCGGDDRESKCWHPSCPLPSCPTPDEAAPRGRCVCGKELDKNGEHAGGYGAWCG